ncbi:MAG: hypothetical protein JWN29_3290 [Acidimicrobiales bacterium]|nr:hypothetical protein [Acidimicrobiales bacterium]
MPTDEHKTRATSDRSVAEHTGIPQYEIRVDGHLASRWVDWFDGLDLTSEDDGTTVLRGPVVDQSGLHGLLQKLRDLGIPLLSLTQLPYGERADGPDIPTQPSHHNRSGATS